MLLAVAAAWLLMASPAPARADTILFVGNSFTFGARSPVWKYRADTVADLNGTGYGGVPALFKLFTKEAGLDYAVSEETVGGRLRRSYGLTEDGATMLRAEAQRMAEAARLVTDAPTAMRAGLPGRKPRTA